MGQPVNKELFFLLACGCGCVWLASPGLAVILGAVFAFWSSSMSRPVPLILLLVLSLWLAACYGVRFGFMEDGQWVGACADDAGLWQCQVRATLGLLIHWRVLAWVALGAALLGFLLPGRKGSVLAVVALLFALPALVLYTASLAVFALVIAALRLVRAPR